MNRNIDEELDATVKRFGKTFNDASFERLERNMKKMSGSVSKVGGTMIEDAAKMKIFGLPMWGWMVLGVLGSVALLLGIIYLVILMIG